jgi:hypothetical protein
MALNEGGLSVKEEGTALDEEGLSVEEEGMPLKKEGVPLKEDGLDETDPDTDVDTELDEDTEEETDPGKLEEMDEATLELEGIARVFKVEETTLGGLEASSIVGEELGLDDTTELELTPSSQSPSSTVVFPVLGVPVGTTPPLWSSPSSQYSSVSLPVKPLPPPGLGLGEAANTGTEDVPGAGVGVETPEVWE